MVAYSTPGYFEVLGARPTMGRGFLDSEAGITGQHPVVVVSHRFWKDRLDGRPDVLGHPLPLDGTPYTIIGVAPQGFVGARVNNWSVDLWVPLSQHPDAAGDGSVFRDRTTTSVQVLGRLRPGATLQQARAAVRGVFANLAAEHPDSNRDRTVKAVHFGRFPAQNRHLDAIAVGGICGLFVVFLLIVCGNLAGMALARTAGKEQEIGVRLALGSSRLRLVRHLMLEAGILSLLGGGLGIAAAVIGMTRVSPMDLNVTAPGATFAPSGWTIGMALALSFGAAQAFGLLPALRFSRPELVSALKDDTGGGGRRVGKLQRFAAAFQTGAAFLLLLMAALFLRSREQVDESLMGFRAEGLAVADFGTSGSYVGFLDPSEVGYPSMDEGIADLIDRTEEAVGSLPGVSSVALSGGFPLDRARAPFSITGDGPDVADAGVRAEYTLVSEGYFSTIGTSILQGRAFRRTDDRTSDHVAVITRSVADRLWPGEEPLERRFWQVGAEGHSGWRVVAVLDHVASSSVKEDYPQVFLPLRQGNTPSFLILLRPAPGVDPALLAEPVRAALRSVDPGLPPARLLPAEAWVDWATLEQRSLALMSGGLGLLILLLAAVGVYGVVALAVANRTREIGLRIAVGASQGTVVRSVVGDVFRLAGPGLALAGLLAAGVATAIRSVLLGLSPVDPLSFLSAGLLLCLVVIGASLVPALRASRISPMDALRRE